MGFFKKTRSGSRSGPGFIKKTQNPTWIRPSYHGITKKPPYIYIAKQNINPNSLISQLTPPASSPSLPHFCSNLFSPHPRPSLPYTAHGLTPHVATLRLTASHLMLRLTHGRRPPHGFTLTHPHGLTLTLQAQPIAPDPSKPSRCFSLLVDCKTHLVICVNQNSDGSIQPSLSCARRRGAYVARRHRRDDDGIRYERIKIGIY